MLIWLKKEYFLQMKEGIKKLEVRVAYNSLKNLKPGHAITFQCGQERINVRIKNIRRYSTFALMLEKEDFRLIAKNKTKQEILKIFQAIYPLNKETLGVLVFEIELI